MVLKVFNKTIVEYIIILKYFMTIFFITTILQVLLTPLDVYFLSPLGISIIAPKFVIVFIGGYYVAKKHTFTLAQAAFGGFLLYIPTIWVQPVVSIISSANFQDFTFLIIFTIGIMFADFFLCSAFALIGSWLASKL